MTFDLALRYFIRHRKGYKEGAAEIGLVRAPMQELVRPLTRKRSKAIKRVHRDTDGLGVTVHQPPSGSAAFQKAHSTAVITRYLNGAVGVQMLCTPTLPYSVFNPQLRHNHDPNADGV